MTTIFACAASGVMVCDSRVVLDTGVWFPCTKIFRWRGELIGVAGDAKDGDAWIDWHKAGRVKKPPKPANHDEFEALILRPSGLFYVTEGAHEIKQERGFHGIGSGGGCAIAVYVALKRLGIEPDAKLCVQAACEADSGTGGRVRVYHLKA